MVGQCIAVRTHRETAWRLHEVLVSSSPRKRAPKKLILDFDATDDPVHGEQDGRFFHGYYRHYCFLPLYVFTVAFAAGRCCAGVIITRSATSSDWLRISA